MGGRKGAKREALDEQCVEPELDESIVRVVALRGSNQVEVEDQNGDKLLCRMPAKFTKSIWIKRGSYVLIKVQKVVVGNGKITGTLSRVLYADHVRQLQKTPFWPAGFQTQDSRQDSIPEARFEAAATVAAAPKLSDSDDDETDDDLPKNLNRQGGGLLYSSSESDDEE